VSALDMSISLAEMTISRRQIIASVTSISVCRAEVIVSGTEITVSPLEMILTAFSIIIWAAEISISVMEISICGTGISISRGQVRNPLIPGVQGFAGNKYFHYGDKYLRSGDKYFRPGNGPWPFTDNRLPNEHECVWPRNDYRRPIHNHFPDGEDRFVDGFKR